MTWNRENATRRIDDAARQAEAIEISDFKRTNQLDNIGLTQAVRLHAVHAYVELQNAPILLDSDQTETERSHKRFLRFLHLYQRIAHIVFQGCEAEIVDFQNHRLHFIVPLPIDDERRRIDLAVTVSEALIQTLHRANDLHPELENVRVRVGIDSGEALAVRNGTRGDRENLFLGSPANHAAKLLGGDTPGIYLSNDARRGLGLTGVGDPKRAQLSSAEIAACKTRLRVPFDVETLVKRWEAEMKETPLAEFAFSRPTPPLGELDLELLTPRNSRRLDTAAIYADIDGFTKFVAGSLASRRGEALAVQALHVIRKELREVLRRDFRGRNIRYIGDCLVGVLAEGSSATDKELTMSTAVLCAAAMRSSFLLIQERLPGIGGLGLAIGLDAGPVSITRLGVKSNRFRCIVGRAVVEAEHSQQRCNGRQTALAPGGHAWANAAVRRLLLPNAPTEAIEYLPVHGKLDTAQDRAIGASGIAAIRPRAWGL